MIFEVCVTDVVSHTVVCDSRVENECTLMDSNQCTRYFLTFRPSQFGGSAIVRRTIVNPSAASQSLPDRHTSPTDMVDDHVATNKRDGGVCVRG